MSSIVLGTAIYLSIIAGARTVHVMRERIRANLTAQYIVASVAWALFHWLS